MFPATLLVPAAGLGARMLLTHPGRPKEMLPVGGRPAVQHALAQGLAAGCRRAVVVLRPGKEALERWILEPTSCVGQSPEAIAEMTRIRDQLDIRVVHQPQPLGECDALACCRSLVLPGPMAVLYPDNIHAPLSPQDPGPLQILARALEDCATDVVALVDPGPANPGVSNSGRVDLADSGAPHPRILAFPPKGPGGFRQRFPGEMRSCGMYLALPHFFEFIERARALYAPLGPGNELTDGKVRRVMLAAGLPIHGAILPGEVFDIGNPAGYAQCRERLG